MAVKANRKQPEALAKDILAVAVGGPLSFFQVKCKMLLKDLELEWSMVVAESVKTFLDWYVIDFHLFFANFWGNAMPGNPANKRRHVTQWWLVIAGRLRATCKGAREVMSTAIWHELRDCCVVLQ